MTLIVPKVSAQQKIHFTHFPEFFAALRDKKYTFSFSAREGGAIRTAPGTSYQVPPDAFTSLRGKPVDEQIHLEITEAHNKKDFFLQDRPSLVGGRLMELGFFIQFRIKGGSELGLRQQKGIQCHFTPSTDRGSNQWQLFRESAARTRSLDQDPGFEWAPGMQNLFWQRDTQNKRKGSFYLEEAGSYTVGRILSRKKRSAPAMLSIRLNGIPQPLDDCRVYLIYNTANSLVRLTPHRDKFTAFNLVRNQAANLLVLGLKAGEAFFYHTYLPEIDNQMLTVRPEKISPVALARKLDYLNL